MCRDAVATMLEQIGKELSIEINPHKWRHTFCTLLVRKGVALPVIAKLAGHASIETVNHFYISTSRPDKQAAVDLL